MKTWWIALPLLLVAGWALADGMEPMPAMDEAAEVPAEPAPGSRKKAKTRRHKAIRLPSGDLRHCLDLTDNAAIIRCAETQPRR